MYRKQQRRKRIKATVAALGMVIVSFVMLWTVKTVRQRVWGVFEQPATDLPTIATETPVALDGFSESGPVTALAFCYDQAGDLVAYRVQTQVTGYNQEVPIVIASTITADNRVLIGMEVLKQKESEYYGARIGTREFADRFAGRYLPIFLTGTAGRGSHVDGVTGATVSSNAVVTAIEHSRRFVERNFVNGEE